MMTHEQRLDRLERVAKLFVKAGLRARSNMRRLDEKIAILIDAQIKGEDRMAELDEKMKMLIQAQMRNDERFAKSDERFAKFESHTDQTLKTLMELIKERRNGKG
ncbi:MAG TPA: hypothetical protein VN696_15330 [Pyrinomonadaceae bacterium]|nr:hypothetical protein [Pyrinomonadaceae bacterium]